MFDRLNNTFLNWIKMCAFVLGPGLVLQFVLISMDQKENRFMWQLKRLIKPMQPVYSKMWDFGFLSNFLFLPQIADIALLHIFSFSNFVPC